MLQIIGNHDEKTIQQMWSCLSVGNAKAGVLCADGHLGYAQPVGGVVAYKDQISISGVGFDIACGNMAVKTDFLYSEIEPRLEEIIKKMQKKIDFGIGGKYSRSRNDKVHTDIFDKEHLWVEAGVRDLKDLAYAQLGTVGSGNHYVDLFEDRDDHHVWIGVHFGSRGLGHKSATRYLAMAGGKDGMDVPPAVIDSDSDLGIQYLNAMHLAGEYAYAGRKWVVHETLKIMGAKAIDTVHNHHNFAWKEKHGDDDFWVVRKGATPAFPSQRGFVGGSMGDDAVIIKGIESDLSKKYLYSTIHGAGRLHGRVAAKGKMDKKTGEWKRPPLFTRAEMDTWLSNKGVKLIGGDVDESPMVYRRLHEVLEHHDGTIEVTNRLRPFLVMMAGVNERDPYKD